MTPQVDGIHYHHTTLLLHPATPNFICIFLHFLVFFCFLRRIQNRFIMESSTDFLVFFCFLRQDLIIGEPSPGVRKEFFFRFFWVFLGFFLSGVMVQPVILAWPLQVGSLDLYHRRRLETTVITSFSSTPYSLKTLYLSSGRFLPSSLHM